MADRFFRPDRRELLAGLTASVLSPALSRVALAQAHRSLLLQAKAGTIALRPGNQATPIWSLLNVAPDPRIDLRRGDELEISVSNELPAPAALAWRGIDGVAAAEPLTVRAPISPGNKEKFVMPLHQAGTFVADIRLLGDGQERPSRAWALVVQESEPVGVDRDLILLIEDWRLRPDGTAIAPGNDPRKAKPVFTVNGQMTEEFAVRTHERLRVRFINGCQRNVIAVKIEGHEVRVMALDSQPAEPFLARNGTIVLAPGTRVDAFIDATAALGSTSPILLHDGKEARAIGRLIASPEPPMRDAPLPTAPPLPSNGLPAQLDLKGALRFDLTLGGAPADWVAPVNFASSGSPAFRANAGRTVVLALSNRADIPKIFHLHGHHFRLLDRLDDGWKPFWLDTLAIEPGRAERIAFAAEYAGRWLMESVAANWAAPRLVACYDVE
jgi:FtsP/CotA-like multicopper oxidase with cupredoxin domain